MIEKNKKDSYIYNTLDSNDIPSWNFLFVGHWLKGDIGHDRKDIGMMIKTFCTVFKDVEKSKQPGLVLKTSTAGFSIMSRDEITKKIKSITDQVGEKCPPIFLLFGDISESELNELYNHPKIKSMISFTKGEGYGRPLQEFALTGKPILVSKWSGPVDFLPEANTVFLDGELTHVHESASDQFLMKETKWFTVNYSNAAQKMYQVYKNYNKFLDQSKPLTNHIKTNFSLDVMTSKFEKIFDKHVRIPEKVELVLPELKKL